MDEAETLPLNTGEDAQEPDGSLVNLRFFCSKFSIFRFGHNIRTERKVHDIAISAVAYDCAHFYTSEGSRGSFHLRFCIPIEQVAMWCSGVERKFAGRTPGGGC